MKAPHNGGRCLILLVAVAAAVTAFDCASCAATYDACCSCCVAGEFSYAVCNAPTFIAGCGVAWASTLSPSMTMTATPSPTGPTRVCPTETCFSMTFGGVYPWVVPPSVRNVSLYLWGAGGGGVATHGVLGGSGAFVSGSALVTPGEVLTITVGNAAFGFGGGGTQGYGGGFTAVSRYSYWTQQVEYLAVAGGGGGGCQYYYPYTGGSATSAPTDGIAANCGTFSPQGKAASDGSPWRGGGGCGWVGGACGGPTDVCPGATSCAGSGGTSCAPGLQPGTIVSAATGAGVAPGSTLSVYVNGQGVSSMPGQAVLMWMPQTPSPTLTASTTASATPTSTPNCPPAAYTTFTYNDIVGVALANALTTSERDCQLACCAVAPRCTSYAFHAALIAAGLPRAPCMLLANATQLVPNNGYTSGVLTSAWVA